MSRLAEAVVVLKRLFSMDGWQLVFRRVPVIARVPLITQTQVVAAFVQLGATIHGEVPGITWCIRFNSGYTEDGHMTA